MVLKMSCLAFARALGRDLALLALCGRRARAARSLALVCLVVGPVARVALQLFVVPVARHLAVVVGLGVVAIIGSCSLRGRAAWTRMNFYLFFFRVVLIELGSGENESEN